MFGPGWYGNPLMNGPSAAPDAPGVQVSDGQIHDRNSFAHAADAAGDTVYQIPCVYADFFLSLGGVASGDGGSGSAAGEAQWLCTRYGAFYDSSARPTGPAPPLPLQAPYARYAYEHPLSVSSDITHPAGYVLEGGYYVDGFGRRYATGLGATGSCTVTISGLTADGDYLFLLGQPVSITYDNPYYGVPGYPHAPKTLTSPGIRCVFPSVLGQDVLAEIAANYAGAPPWHRYISNLDTVLNPAYLSLVGLEAGSPGPFGSPAFSQRTRTTLRILVGGTFSAAFSYAPPGKTANIYTEELSDANPLTLVTSSTAARPAAWLRVSLQPAIAADQLGGVATNAYFETDIARDASGLNAPYYPFSTDAKGNAAPIALGLYPALQPYNAPALSAPAPNDYSLAAVAYRAYHDPLVGAPVFPFHTGLGYPRGGGPGTQDYLTLRVMTVSQRSLSADLGGGGGLVRLDHLPPISSGISGLVYPHDADIAVTVFAAPRPFSSRGDSSQGVIGFNWRWFWNASVHATGHLSDHDAGGTAPPAPPTDTDLSDKGALDQDPATGRVYLAKTVAGQLQIAAREGWQGLGGTPARDYTPLLGPDGAAVAGKSPHLASRTAGGDGARGGLTTVVYQDGGSHVVLAMSDDGLHTIGAPTMPIFAKTGGLPCHLHDESTGLTYVAASFAVAPAATAPAGTVSTTEDLRLVRLGGDLRPVLWADGMTEKLIKAGSPKAGRPSLTQNRMDPEQPLLLIHGDKKYAGTLGGELWAEIIT